jgi:hypothetical protein
LTEPKSVSSLPNSKTVRESLHDPNALIVLGDLAIAHVLDNQPVLSKTTFQSTAYYNFQTHAILAKFKIFGYFTAEQTKEGHAAENPGMLCRLAVNPIRGQRPEAGSLNDKRWS